MDTVVNTKGLPVDCSSSQFIKDAQNSQFLRLMRHEERRAHECKAQELLATKENPRIKEQENQTHICSELREIKEQEFLAERKRKQLYDNSYELRQLATQIRSAYVSKQLSEQKEQAAQRLQNLAQQKQKEAEEWNREYQRMTELQAKEDQEAAEKKRALRIHLLKQMDETREKTAEHYQSILKDRQEMLRKMQNLEAEDEKKELERLQYRERCRQEMEKAHHDKLLRLQREKEQAMFDSSEGIRMIEERERMRQQVIAERKRKQGERQALSDQIGKQLEDLNMEKEARENVLLSLLIEERKANEDSRERHSLEKRIEERIQLRQELEMYLHQIQQKKILKGQEDQELQDEQQRFLKEKDQEEQQRVARRKEMMHKYRLATLNMIEESQQRRAQDTMERIQDFENILAKQREIDNLINEERHKMLSETPKDVLRFLPSHALNPGDREFLKTLTQ